MKPIYVHKVIDVHNVQRVLYYLTENRSDEETCFSNWCETFHPR